MNQAFSSPLAGTIGLIVFFVYFVGVLLWVYRPGSKKEYQQKANIPLQDDMGDQ